MENKSKNLSLKKINRNNKSRAKTIKPKLTAEYGEKIDISEAKNKGD